MFPVDILFQLHSVTSAYWVKLECERKTRTLNHFWGKRRISVARIVVFCCLIRSSTVLRGCFFFILASDTGSRTWQKWLVTRWLRSPDVLQQLSCAVENVNVFELFVSRCPVCVRTSSPLWTSPWRLPGTRLWGKTICSVITTETATPTGRVHNCT